MQLNSFVYILLFLPLTVTFYYVANKINVVFGKYVLIISSVVFYCYTNIAIFLTLGMSIVANYIFSKLITKTQRWKKFYLFVPILINIGLLLYYKYANFAISNVNAMFGKEFHHIKLILPVGISFFTFQQISYVVAIYKRELENDSLVDYLLFILFFPKLLMGPLTDPVDFINQLNDIKLKKINWENVANGIKIFSLGLFKKLMIADVFAKAVEWGYSNMDVTTSMDWILIMLFYTFEIYFDFSGYSDMAVGSSLLLNIKLPINFDSPYKAMSIREFWKRWHISLTKFLTKYVYIPLGGNKKGKFFTCLNTMIVFIVSGIWHGANWTFVLWGFFHGAFSVFDRLFDKKLKKIFEPVRWICTFVIVNILWLLFRSETIQQWRNILVKILSFQNLNISNGIINAFLLPESVFITNTLGFERISGKMRGFWMNLYLFVAFCICLLFDNNYERLTKRSWVMMVLAAIAFVWGFICLGSESLFVYFNF